MRTSPDVPAVIEHASVDQGDLIDSIMIFIKDPDDPSKGHDFQKKLEDLGLSFESTDDEVLSTIRPLIQEAFNIDIKNGSEWLFKVHRADDRGNFYIIPNSVAG